jgi:acetyl-CoA carboxylase biotin carboxyl carrier protein
MEVSLKQLKSLLKTLAEGGASELEYKDEKYSLRLTLGVGAPVVHYAPQATSTGVASVAPGALAKEDEGAVFVTSPFVGTFYRSSAPDADPFVDVGQSVKAGQALCIVEAMKLMNEIESEYSGVVSEVLVENGTSVEFGQKLFKLKQA